MACVPDGNHRPSKEDRIMFWRYLKVTRKSLMNTIKLIFIKVHYVMTLWLILIIDCNSQCCLPPPFFPHRYGNLHTFPSPMAYPTQDSRKSNFPPHVSLSGIAFFFLSSFRSSCTSSCLDLSWVVTSFSSIATCPSTVEVLAPFVAISLDLAELKLLLAVRRETSAPVHVDSSFADFLGFLKKKRFSFPVQGLWCLKWTCGVTQQLFTYS